MSHGSQGTVKSKINKSIFVVEYKLLYLIGSQYHTGIRIALKDLHVSPKHSLCLMNLFSTLCFIRFVRCLFRTSFPLFWFLPLLRGTQRFILKK